jgi:protein arginine kinase
MNWPPNCETTLPSCNPTSLTSLRDRPAEWLERGPEGDVVLSSRVCLTRNIDGYPFVARATDRQRARVEELLRNVLMSVEIVPPLHYLRLDRLDDLQRQLLAERHLIGPDAVVADWVRAVAFDSEERTSLAINDEDHLRIQCTRRGLRLHEAAEHADGLDDALAQRVPFAFSMRHGYLCANPGRAGTGLRGGVTLHLPGIVMSREMEPVSELLRTRRVRLRGAFGPGAFGCGDMYEICNSVSLGVAEEEIIDMLADTAVKLVEIERGARSELAEADAGPLRERIMRARDLLQNAASLTSQEALGFLSQLRLGVESNILQEPSNEAISWLLLLTLPAHLQTMEGSDLDTAVRNELRAGHIRDVLSGQ